MANASNYLRDAWLNHTLRGVAFTAPTATYLALHTADPGADGSGAEVSGGAYARVEVTADTNHWAAPGALDDDRAVTNLLDEAFPEPTGADWGLVTHWALWDAATTGNLLIYGELPTARTILDGDLAPVMPASAITISIGPTE